MVINAFFEKKTQKPRHEERSPNRGYKHQNLAQRNVEGADYQLRAQRRFSVRDQWRSQREKAQR